MPPLPQGLKVVLLALLKKKEGTARVRNKDTEEGRDKRAIPDSCLRLIKKKKNMILTRGSMPPLPRGLKVVLLALLKKKRGHCKSEKKDMEVARDKRAIPDSCLRLIKKKKNMILTRGSEVRVTQKKMICRRK